MATYYRYEDRQLLRRDSFSYADEGHRLRDGSDQGSARLGHRMDRPATGAGPVRITGCGVRREQQGAAFFRYFHPNLQNGAKRIEGFLRQLIGVKVVNGLGKNLQ